MKTQEPSLERSALVAYGSETGNAQELADELARLAQRLRFVTRVSNLDAVEPSTLSKYSVVIIAVSTTGQGDLPINSRSFWKSLLRRKLPSTYLEDVLFTTFGLGDSSYPKFNWAVRKLEKRFLQLGAVECYPRGEGDEQHPEGLDASFVPWSADLRQSLLRRFPLGEGINAISADVLLEPKWALSLMGNVTSNPQRDVAMQSDVNLSQYESTRPPEVSLQKNISSKNDVHNVQSLAVTLENNQRLTPNEHWQDVRHLVFSSHSPYLYEPGDVLTIYPRNRLEDVDLLLTMMQWTDIADKPIQRTHMQPSLGKKTAPPAFSGVDLSRFTTLRRLLTDSLDFTAIPRRSFFSTIAHFTLDQTHKERLQQFTKPEYIDELYDYTTRPRRSILEVLQEFKSVRIPWQWAADVLPKLRGRQFSIASGGELKCAVGKGARFELLVAIVQYRTVIKKIREGVCTRYLAALPSGTQLQVALQKGGLGVSKTEAKYPVVMIGPGTGVAPMRSLIWERLQWGRQMVSPSQYINGTSRMDNESTIGESVLFFGCRRRDADYFFKDEWAKLSEEMPLQVFTAFSRDQTRKIYVQDLIREQSSLIFRLLHQCKGIVYVCGSSGKMPRGVREALIEAFRIGGGMDQAAADEYLLAMEKQGRYRQETW